MKFRLLCLLFHLRGLWSAAPQTLMCRQILIICENAKILVQQVWSRTQDSAFCTSSKKVTLIFHSADHTLGNTDVKGLLSKEKLNIQSHWSLSIITMMQGTLCATLFNLILLTFNMVFIIYSMIVEADIQENLTYLQTANNCTRIWTQSCLIQNYLSINYSNEIKKFINFVILESPPNFSEPLTQG